MCTCAFLCSQKTGQPVGICSLLLQWGPGDKTQVTRRGGKPLYPLSYLVSPLAYLFLTV